MNRRQLKSVRARIIVHCLRGNSLFLPLRPENQSLSVTKSHWQWNPPLGVRPLQLLVCLKRFSFPPAGMVAASLPQFHLLPILVQISCVTRRVHPHTGTRIPRVTHIPATLNSVGSPPAWRTPRGSRPGFLQWELWVVSLSHPHIVGKKIQLLLRQIFHIGRAVIKF